jgi:hypothetical protein
MRTKEKKHIKYLHRKKGEFKYSLDLLQESI